MNIDNLIQQGCTVKSKCYKTSTIAPSYISGEDYEKWIRISIRFLEQNYPNDTFTNDFREVGLIANGNGIKYFDKMIAILDAIKQMPGSSKTNDIMPVIKSICNNFNKCAKQLLNRRKENGKIRETVKITDEYDVQDLLHSILKLFVNDIRTEDYVPSYAGGNSRIDFYLPEYKTYIETKMTRDKLKDKEIGEELLIDIGRYSGKCDTLICFIYDIGNHLQNPYGLITDLESKSTSELSVKVYISPI